MRLTGIFIRLFLKLIQDFAWPSGEVDITQHQRKFYCTEHEHALLIKSFRQMWSRREANRENEI